MRKLDILIFILLSLFVAGYFLRGTSPKEIKNMHKPVDKSLEKPSFKDEKKTYIKRAGTQKAHRAFQAETPHEATEKTAQSLVLESIDIAELSEVISPRKYVKPIGGLHIEMEKLKSLQIGDTFSLPNIDDSDYKVLIDTVDLMDGSQSFSGVFTDEGIRYSVTVTAGEEGSAYIHLNTPKGAYEIEIDKGSGYIYRSSDIRQVLSDESKDDAVLVTLPEEGENK